MNCSLPCPTTVTRATAYSDHFRPPSLRSGIAFPQSSSQHHLLYLQGRRNRCGQSRTNNFRIFILFYFLHFNLVDGLSTLVQVPCFTSTMRCIISMHIVFIILYGFSGLIFKNFTGRTPHPPLTLSPHQY